MTVVKPLRIEENRQSISPKHHYRGHDEDIEVSGSKVPPVETPRKHRQVKIPHNTQDDQVRQSFSTIAPQAEELAVRRRLEKQLIDEDQSISSRNGVSSISVANQGTSNFGNPARGIMVSRNQSQPSIRSHSTEQLNTPGRVIRAHHDKRRE